MSEMHEVMGGCKICGRRLIVLHQRLASVACHDSESSADTTSS
jgi:hypothetical protein